MYSKCKEEILELISISENNQRNMHIITVFDDPYKVEAASGMIFPIEISDVETGFSFASTYYTGYKDYFSFKKDVEENKFSDPNIKYLVYSTHLLLIDHDWFEYSCWTGFHPFWFMWFDGGPRCLLGK